MSEASTRSDSAALAMVTLDCAETAPVAGFWAELLGYEVLHLDENYAMLRGETGPAIGFGRVEDHQPPAWPNPQGTKQFHFDLAVEDIDIALERCVGLGATAVDPQPGETWRVLLDPAGHPFCLTKAANWG